MSTSHEDRGRVARRAWEALGPNPGESVVLMVQCASSHHLAAVFGTPAGPVFHTVLHSRSHGRRDYQDLGHHASRRGRDWFDLLDAGDPLADDELPAGCDCGPYTLSRRELVGQLADGQKKVIIR